MDGDRDATGAVLTKNLRFTEDLIESLRHAFLNSSWSTATTPASAQAGGPSPGRRGHPRMAAGLARALMGIGVRAVVAAGWPVNDTAAMVFAVTLHEQLTAGRTYGEAVAGPARRALI